MFGQGEKRFRPALAVALVTASLAAIVLGGLSASAAGTAPPADGYRIVLGSDRDGATRAYSLRSDGSTLTPLLPRGRRLVPVIVSRDGHTIAYIAGAYAPTYGPIYVSRADGTGLRRLVRNGYQVALSRDGRLLAFTRDGSASGIWIVGTDGRGLRRATSGPDRLSDWSPDGTALVFSADIDEFGDRDALVAQPLGGKRRVLVHKGPPNAECEHRFEPKWSPDGRWIAYTNLEDEQCRTGLWVIRPDGARRHRVARQAGEFSWSPDGRRLAFLCGGVCVVGVDGRGLRRLRLAVSAGSSLDEHPWSLAWPPDGRRLALSGNSGGHPSRDDPTQIWVVGVDGRGLRRLTSDGENSLVGWTRLAPVLPPASELPPTERVLEADTVATRTPVADLSADGPRVAFIANRTATDCEHVAVWTPGEEPLRRFRLPSPCVYHVYDVELAGSRAAWVSYWGDMPVFTLMSATLADQVPRALAEEDTGKPKQLGDFHLRGDGDLLVFNAGSQLVRTGTGRERTLRRGAHASPVDSVSGGLIAIREPDAVAVLDGQGKLVRIFPFEPRKVTAARLDGGHLVVARSAMLEAYDLATGARELSRPLPTGYGLADVDDGIAVLRRSETVILVRLADGASLTLKPGRGPVLADLEPPGLYYSYATGDGGGRLVFLPRSELLRQLG